MGSGVGSGVGCGGMRSPVLLALLAVAALTLTGILLVGGPDPSDPVVTVEPTDIPVGGERIYEGDLASSHDGFGYRLDVVGCDEGGCTAVVTATNEGEDPAEVETAYFLHVGGRRLTPIGYSGEGFTRPAGPGEAVELRIRFPAAGPTSGVTRFEVSDTVAANGFLFDL